MMHPEDLDPIDGSQPIRIDLQGDVGALVTTEDGRQWYWKSDMRLYECHGQHWLDEGEWVEYK